MKDQVRSKKYENYILSGLRNYNIKNSNKGTSMKSLFFKTLNSLLFTVALFATINTFGMEQQEENLEVTQEHNENSDTVVERMYNALSKQLEERFPKAPTTFYEAIVRLKCIAKLLENPEINFSENFNTMQDTCIIIQLSNSPPHTSSNF